jgi:hypothetical protein
MNESRREDTIHSRDRNTAEPPRWGAVKFSHIPTSSEVGSDVTTYAGLAKRLKMLKCCHTHLVRGGLLMLQPAWEPRNPAGIPRARASDTTSDEVGMPEQSRPHSLINSSIVVGSSIRDPPLTRWVCAKT